MAERVLGTGVELRLRTADAYAALERGDDPGEVAIEAQVFTDVADDGRRYRVGGVTAWSEGWVLASGFDPTSALVAIADEMRENLGDLLGDMRRGGCDVTRFEFYASPFRIELDDPLREALGDRWNERPPRVPQQNP